MYDILLRLSYYNFVRISYIICMYEINDFDYKFVPKSINELNKSFKSDNNNNNNNFNIDPIKSLENHFSKFKK